MVEKDALVTLGVIARPHGVRGELRVKLHNPASELLYSRAEVFLCKNSIKRIARISRVHKHQTGVLIMEIEGCSSRIEAEQLRGVELCIPRSAFPELSPDEYYHVDLIGLRVEKTNGEVLGKVEAVIDYPTVDILRVISDRGVLEIPILEPYLVEMDIGGGTIVVDCLEDLEWERPKKPKRR